jgi:hypothetical protein
VIAEDRLRGWLFRCDRGNGRSQVVVFYAATAAEATKHASNWAEPRGYSVELVRDEPRLWT